jgi:hypothetical protein
MNLGCVIKLLHDGMMQVGNVLKSRNMESTTCFTAVKDGSWNRAVGIYVNAFSSR